MTKSNKTSNPRQKFDFRMKPKINKNYFPHPFRSLLCIWFVAVLAFRSEEEVFFKKGTTRDLFLPRPGSTPGQIWLKHVHAYAGS